MYIFRYEYIIQIILFFGIFKYARRPYFPIIEDDPVTIQTSVFQTQEKLQNV